MRFESGSCKVWADPALRLACSEPTEVPISQLPIFASLQGFL